MEPSYHLPVPVNRSHLTIVQARPVPDLGGEYDRVSAELGFVAGGVYVTMRRAADADGRLCESYGDLATRCRLSRRQTMRLVTQLVGGGFVDAERQRDERGGHAPNVFTFPPDPSDKPDISPSDTSLAPSDKPLVTDPSDILAGASSANPDKKSLRSNDRNSGVADDEGDTPPNPPDEKPRRRQLTAWPDDLTLTDERRATAAAAGVDPERQWQRFRDYCAANDKRYRDWDAAWRNWVSSPYQGNGRTAGTGRHPATYGNGARPFAEWSDDELLRWSPPPGHRGGVPSEVRMARIRRLQADEAGR
jgi:hypothetical protein